MNKSSNLSIVNNKNVFPIEYLRIFPDSICEMVPDSGYWSFSKAFRKYPEIMLCIYREFNLCLFFCANCVLLKHNNLTFDH